MKAYILLDRSGSMATHWVEMIGALNAYVSGLSSDKATKKSEVTVVAFDSADPFMVLRNSVKAADWSQITAEEVSPRGGTPLFDAIGKLVTTIRKDAPKKATIVIITDGAENSSMEVKKEAAKAMLDDMRAKNFDVVFIGANFDAFAQGAGLGNMASSTLNMNAGNYGAAMKGLSARSVSYASTGTVGSFSDDERKRAAGVK